MVARQFRGAGSAMNVDRDSGKRRNDVQKLEKFALTVEKIMRWTMMTMISARNVSRR